MKEDLIKYQNQIKRQNLLKRKLLEKPIEFLVIKRQGILIEDYCVIPKEEAKFLKKKHGKKIVLEEKK